MPDTDSGGTSSPHRHRLVKILEAQNSAIAMNTEILAVIARKISSIDRQHSAIIRSLSEFHGKREAAEAEEAKDRRKKGLTLDTILYEVRKVAGRVSRMEPELEELRIHAMVGKPGTDGGGPSGVG